MIPEPMRADAAIRQMQRSLDRGRGLCLLAGTGLTIAATGDPGNSWPDLIRRGAVACEKNGYRDRSWVERVAADVGTGEIGDVLAAAEKVTYGLGGQENARFYEWLRETVGSVQPKHLELLDQVKRLANHEAVVVLTTNYDSLLSDHLGIPLVTWRDPLPVLQDAYVDHRRRAVIHVHGHWPDLPSIVFGAASYAKLRAHPSALDFLKQAFLANTVATVGVGAGLADPTFRLLLDWADAALNQTRTVLYFHVPEPGAPIPVHPAITPVPLSSHAELVERLKQLKVERKPLRGAESDADRMPLAIVRLRQVRKLAASGRQTEEAARAQTFVSINRDELARILDETTETDHFIRAWADRLIATWQAMTENLTKKP